MARSDPKETVDICAAIAEDLWIEREGLRSIIQFAGLMSDEALKGSLMAIKSDPQLRQSASLHLVRFRELLESITAGRELGR